MKHKKISSITKKLALVISFTLLVTFSVSVTNIFAKADLINMVSSNSEQSVQNVLVKFKKGVSEKQKIDFANAYGLSKKSDIPAIGWSQYRLPTDKIPAEVLSKILAKRGAEIENVQLDELVPATEIPNDPYYPSQWHHQKINSETAWDLHPQSDVIIAVGDTGVDVDHPDLQANLLPGYNTATVWFWEDKTDVTDLQGHGTATIGTAAAIGGNGTGVVGSSYSSKILPIKVTYQDSGSAYHSDMAEAIVYAADHGAKVINLSFGPMCDATIINDAAQYMYDRGGLVTISAGNDGTDMACGDVPSVLYVSATDSSNLKTSWSTYGGFVDVAAPGLNILTTANGGGYQYISGTSFSAPMTAGVIALLFSQNPELTNAEVEAYLKNNALDLGTAGYDKLYGFGLINSGAAITAIHNDMNTTPDPDPEPDPDPTLDTEEPVINLVSPLEGENLPSKGGLTITVEATDNVEVSTITIALDQNELITCLNTQNCSASTNANKMADGEHTITIDATDSSGNLATLSQINSKVTSTDSGDNPGGGKGKKK